MIRIKRFNEKNLSWVAQKVEIRMDIDASRHVMDRTIRHGLDSRISESEIIEDVEKSIEQLTISLMQDELNINETFHIHNNKTNLHMVARLYPGKNEFKLVLITIMREKDFKVRGNEFVINVS